MLGGMNLKKKLRNVATITAGKHYLINNFTEIIVIHRRQQFKKNLNYPKNI